MGSSDVKSLLYDVSCVAAEVPLESFTVAPLTLLEERRLSSTKLTSSRVSSVRD